MNGVLVTDAAAAAAAVVVAAFVVVVDVDVAVDGLDLLLTLA